jgi:hypothetical protein
VASNGDLPRAYLARVPFPAGGKVSAVLVPRPMGFLAVRLLHDGWPVVGRQVQFFVRQEDAEDEKGDALGKAMLSDDDGVARLPRLVAIGTYVCEVDEHDVTVVCTVNRLRAAVPLQLPIGSEAIDNTEDVSDLSDPAQEPEESA